VLKSAPIVPGLCAFTIRKFNGELFVLNKEEFDMRHLVIAVVVAAGACFVGAFGASAAPANGQAISQSAEQGSSVTKVWGGCGRGWHRNRWGRCVP
jgi:hypothetical protein